MKLKLKLISIIVSGILLAVISPAQAQAPRINEKTKLFQLALQHPKKYAFIKMKDYGWFKIQYVCLNKLWTKESHWNYKANNPKSSAFGIAQMLKETSVNPVIQINNGLRYIKHRYGEPCKAWNYWQRHYWY